MTTAIRCWLLVDGTGGVPLTDAVLIIDGGKIAAVGPRRELQIPKAAEVLDVGEKTVLPGLIDMHGHLGVVWELDSSAAQMAQPIEGLLTST